MAVYRRAVTCPECGRLVADTGTTYRQGRRRLVRLRRHKRAAHAGLVDWCPASDRLVASPDSDG